MTSPLGTWYFELAETKNVRHKDTCTQNRSALDMNARNGGDARQVKQFGTGGNLLSMLAQLIAIEIDCGFLEILGLGFMLRSIIIVRF